MKGGYAEQTGDEVNRGGFTFPRLLLAFYTVDSKKPAEMRVLTE
jgi:hypothetical protein